MTAPLVAQGLSGGYGHRVLFDWVDLTVAPGDGIGVVGAYGAGRTTLLRLLAGGATHGTAGRRSRWKPRLLVVSPFAALASQA